MARGDSRRSPKMLRIKAKNAKKARAKRAAVATRESRKA
jgi:hypothetical protein